ncbi:MAG: methylenetetrahydrofolate dehydrogenase / methenyltetrahydrofolate cyclohydrolase [Streptosporangiaceae bacterium]|nr:methylenetetrahydrofolate dehydrogenase / methenyltetrahydrofolate cyclohydrolase [Streptosporangiaceae bacterium]
MTHLVDGRTIAVTMATAAAAAADVLRSRGITPTLAVLVPTDDAGAAWYVRSIQRSAARTGVACQVHRMGGPLRAEQIAGRLAELSLDPAVHGVICQAPLPAGVDLPSVGRVIPVGKDVDGANPASLGGLAAGLPAVFAPATAAAVLAILRHERIPLSGRRAVVVGRSTVVGKPAALLLLAEHATVTIAHSRTQDLRAVCREAEVLVVAAGQPKLIGAEHIRPAAVVIDVGTSPTDGGKLVGDVDAAAVTGIASVLTPVPGGVGPVTTAVLMQHVLQAAARAATSS